MATTERVLTALLAMQRRSWEQGVAGQAFLDLGRADLAAVVARDAVANQLPDGRLADLGDRNVANGAAALEPVLGVPDPDGSLAAAAGRQVRWLLEDGPRADDGTLMHVLDRPQVWADTVYMVVPGLVLAGHADAAAAQLAGHRERLQHGASGLFAHIWDEDAGRLSRAAAWGGGNGWVAAACARSVRLLGSSDGDGLRPAAVELGRTVLDACLAHRAASGLFHDVVDDPTSFEEVTLVAMLAYTASVGAADGWLPASYAGTGRDLLATAEAHVGDDGLLRPACGTPAFDRPGISAEAQAWYLMAVAAG